MVKVTPAQQYYFGRYPEKAVMGAFPSLSEIRTAYGTDFDVEWLVPQLADMSLFTGAKNITEQQQESLARMISVEYEDMKITEMLLFFHRFKTGHYGKFYGTFDPMAVMLALQEFRKERNHIFKLEDNRMRENEEARIRQAWPSAATAIQEQAGIASGDIWLDVIDLNRMKVRLSVINGEVMKKVLEEENREKIAEILKEKIGGKLRYTVYRNVGGGEERGIDPPPVPPCDGGE